MANDSPKTPFDSWLQQRCHPNAPAGGGGPGCFTTAGPLGASDSGWQGLPHPNSPAGRCLTAQDIRLPVLPERVESVVKAYFQALRLAPGAVYQETGYQLDQIKEGLLPGLLQMLAVLGISVMAGAAAGTAIGFFLGGVGAAPGAVVGAELGLEIGTAIITWLGLGFLVVAIGQGMGELTGVLIRAIRRAWHAEERLHPQFEIDRAAEDLARAEGILFRLILQGLLAYVLKNGAVSSSQAALSTGQTIARGGTRAAADETLAEVSVLLRSSKLPEEFVVWIERNWEDLKRNPKLASNKTAPTVSSQASSPAATPSELKAMRERQGRDDVAETSGNESKPVTERTNHEKIASDERSVNDEVMGKDYSDVPDSTGLLTQETSTVFRVQGGAQPLASRQHIVLDADGNPKINRTTLNISIGDPKHAEYFLSKRPGANITSFEIPKWMDDFIQTESVPQANYRSNPLNQDGLAPKIVDPATPGRSYELPSIWTEWLEETAIKGSGKVTN